MKRLTFLAVLATSFTAFAAQQTFTTMGSLDCSAGETCTQTTTDGTLTLEFPNTQPRSGPTPSGLRVNAPYVSVSPTPAAAPTGNLDMSILVLTVNTSSFFNGAFYVGSVLLSTFDPATNTWTDVASWSMQAGRSRYILLNGSTFEM
ncbi:MAG: hypothetical protein JXB05_15665 [Myxococcaceae bacterium]|nr:hypothetical protein [Myxococcaceae bacterium]